MSYLYEYKNGSETVTVDTHTTGWVAYDTVPDGLEGNGDLSME